jgi:GNAT superfamily N-acetyltransferase
MGATATPTSASSILALRVRHRQEMNGQIVHDSLHRRAGWTTTYALQLEKVTVGFGSMAIGGPWAGQPTIFEFYVLPAHRTRALDLFEVLLETSGARQMTVQSNDLLITAMLHTYARDVRSEAIVFHDVVTTALEQNGAVLEQVTSDEDTQSAIAQRQGGPEWSLRIDGEVVGSGGVLFHYNAPYGDVYMEVAEPARRRGIGAYLVQELKRLTYELGAVPCARCSPANVASRKTLQKAGFVPFAHLLRGALAPV